MVPGKERRILLSIINQSASLEINQKEFLNTIRNIIYLLFSFFFLLLLCCNKQANSLRSSAWPRTSLFLVLLRSMNCRLMHPSSSQDTGPGKCSRVSSLLFRVAMQPVDVASRHELASKISLAKIDDG